MKLKGLFLLTLLTFFTTLCRAAQVQQASESNMADLMRSNGKIYVVVAVIGIVFIGLICYLIMLDKKIAGMEKQKDIRA